MRPSPSDRILTTWLRRGWRGFHTLLRLRRATGGSGRLLARTTYGSMFSLNPAAYIDGIVLREGYYESEVFEALRPFLGTSAVFWDIGANFGLHSITASLLEPETHVLAFEPSQAMVSEIQLNGHINGSEVDVIPLALAESGEPAILHINDAGNPGMSTLHPWTEGHYDRQVTVECARGDSLVASRRAPAPTVIKLDVEGSEAEVLAGLGDLLHRPELRAIVFEAGVGLGQAPDSDPIAGPLRAAGFRFVPLARQEDSAHSLGNYLATRLG